MKLGTMFRILQILRRLNNRNSNLELGLIPSKIMQGLMTMVWRPNRNSSKGIKAIINKN